ncbi:MAG: hypothetical protein ACHQ50_01215 [Fimbriimonadales bacterium]
MLLPILVFLSMAGRDARPMIAFTARIYYPPGDRRIAHHQVDVSQLDGSHRKRLSSDRFDCDGVRWIGDHKLAWIEYQPGHEDDIGFRGDDSKPLRLVLFDLVTERRGTVATGRITGYSRHIGWCGSATGRRGDGLYSIGSDVQRLTAGGSFPYKETDDPEADQNDDAVTWKWRGLPTVKYVGPEGPNLVTNLSGGGTEEGPAPVFERNGRRHTFLVGGDVVHVTPSHRDPDITWCLTGSYAGSAGSHEWIYRMDWKTDKAKCVVDDLLDIDFQPDNRYYAGITTNKVTRPLGKKMVWARDVVAGDLQTGKRWIVLGGLVHATSVSIQPGG